MDAYRCPYDMERAISSLRQLLDKSYPQILAAISMFAFVSTVTVSNGGSILVVIIIFSTPLSPSCEEGGALTHSQALALSKRARDVTSMLLRRFFPTTPSLLHKEGSTAFPKPFSPQGTRDVTAPPVALNRCAIRLAGHQSPRQDCFSGDEPAGVILIKWWCGMGPQGDLVAIRLLTGLHLELFPSGL